MAKHSSTHGVRGGVLRVLEVLRVRAWNRGDLAILLCGVLGFLSLTFGAPLLKHGEAAVPAAELSARSRATPSSVPWPLSATGGAQGAPAESASAAETAAPGPVLPEASAPLRILYPAAAIDTAVHPLEPDASAVATRTVEPPTTMDGYWLTPFGTPGNGSGNTTYIIGHSWEGRDAPFNHLSSAAVIGDTFEVVTVTGTIPYRVDSVTTYLKDSLKDSPIWDMVPSRVVLISCYTEDPWGKNVVVSASPAAG
ncbi:class F sortase [Pseudarthrobacter raffinosi]|uniref:class F sortase n=1 Tax=Pseudarthrobacter raffinosi TaxID=2953651 RepID=UPI00208F9FB0|nr:MULTISPECIES: class F sortase [unclassified Pseudarthrobacter]MCO4237367.1 class F sortase [Pseudarthrobacter sp. MDT3-28]MCO4253063.1 class F sortase [Pseudarthrobacter sp. MDT3-9]